MTLDEFYTAFKNAASKMKWQISTGHYDSLIRAEIGSVDICPVNGVYFTEFAVLLNSWDVRKAADGLGLSDEDASLLICAADNEILKDVSVEERDRCRTRLLQITGLSNEIDPTTESNATGSFEGSR